MSQFHLSWQKNKKFTSSWIQMGQHISTNLESLQHCWNMTRLLSLLSLVISFSAANARNASTRVEPLRCVLERDEQSGSSPPWLLEKLPIWLITGFPAQPQGAAAAPWCRHQPAQGAQENRIPGLLMVPGWQGRGARLSSTRWNISLLSLSAEHFTIDLPE